MPYDPEDPDTKAAIQAEVERVAAKIRDEAKNTGAKEAEEQIRTYLADEAEKQRLASLEGEEKLREEIRAANEARAAAEQTAAQLAADSAARQALLAAGFAPATLDDAVKLLGDGELADTVPALAERLPALLGTTGDGTTPTPVTPPPKPKGPAGGKTAAERAAERFASSPLAKTA